MIENDQAIEQALVELKKAVDNVEAAIEIAVHRFISECRQERHEMRKQITLAGAKSQRYSQAVIVTRTVRGYIELTWAQIWYAKGNSTPRFKRIPMAKGCVHLARLKSGAHEDEYALLALHEAKARAYRDIIGRGRKIFHAAWRLHERFSVLTTRIQPHGD